MQTGREVVKIIRERRWRENYRSSEKVSRGRQSSRQVIRFIFNHHNISTPLGHYTSQRVERGRENKKKENRTGERSSISPNQSIHIYNIDPINTKKSHVLFRKRRKIFK